MKKTEAINLLGGTTASAAIEVGVAYQAVDKWPEVLPTRITDRVTAALARKCEREKRRNDFWVILRSISSEEIHG